MKTSGTITIYCMAEGISNFLKRTVANECLSLDQYKTIWLCNKNIEYITMNETTSASLTMGGNTNTRRAC